MDHRQPDLGIDRRQLRRRSGARQTRPGQCRASVVADPQSLPVQTRAQPRRDLVAQGPRAVAARPEAVSLPAHRAAAAAAGRRRIARDAGGDRLTDMAPSLPAIIAHKLRTEKFRLLDVGCSGGIDTIWRAFEPRLQALGIDASDTECKRLADIERNPDVSYVAAFVSSSA